MLAQSRQQLAFEPPDLGPLLGAAADAGTLGGALACNLAGPRRLTAGAARDHLLGFKAVNGHGEVFKAGGRVVKNVTGYDLSKLITGSYGTLAVLTEVSIKVLPRPEKTRTVLVCGLDDAAAIRVLAGALSSINEPTAAAHLPAAVAARSAVGYVAQAGGAVTALRLEGFAPSVEARCAALKTELGALGTVEELHSSNSLQLWRELRDAAPLVGRPELVVWRWRCRRPRRRRWSRRAGRWRCIGMTGPAAWSGSASRRASQTPARPGCAPRSRRSAVTRH